MFQIAYAVATLLVAAAALPTTTSSSSPSSRSTGTPRSVSSFKNVPTSTDIRWTPCYKHFKCANLRVPLDYEDESVGTTVVAWIRQDAANGTGTDLLFNPGGPGGSGIDYLLSGGGDDIMEMTGGKYNIVSFDPRGVNASAIDLTCFPGNSDGASQFDASAYSTEQEKYAAAVAYNRWCSVTTSKTKVRYAGTVAVVQDLIHFTELQAAQKRKNPKEALIWYYGVSYGTVIGQTLAALYPDRIGRLMIDANVNGEDHYHGTTDTAVQDADDAVRYFFRLCVEAGSKACPFAGNATSAQDVEVRFNALLQSLEKAPLQSIAPQFDGPVIVTKDRVLNQIFSWLYNPTAYFPYMSLALNALAKGNATTWLQIENATSVEDTPGPFNYTSTASQEVLHLVTSIDAAGRYPYKNVDEYMKAVDELEKTDAWFGEGYGATNTLINAGSTIMPPKSQFFKGFKQTKTKNAVLLLNTNADPITPLSSAKHMSAFFEGSVVLTQNSGGHSVTAVRSGCTVGYVREYLKSGKLPKDGTICEPSANPLGGEKRKRSVPLVRRRIQGCK